MTKRRLVDELLKTPGRPEAHYPSLKTGMKKDYAHQVDLLFLPNDDGYKYALVVADIATRLIDARPLKSKDATEVLDALNEIYRGNLLKRPTNLISMDSGSEWAKVKTAMKKIPIHIKVAAPGRHSQQAIVENANLRLGKLLFKRMTAEELVTKEPSRDWVDYLPEAVTLANERAEKRLMDHIVNEAIMDDPPTSKMGPLPHFQPQKPILKEPILTQGTRVRAMLDEPVHAHDLSKAPLGRSDSGFRATDIRFSPTPRTIEMTLIAPGAPVLYVLSKMGPLPHFGRHGADPTIAYTRQQLQVIEPDEVPPSEADIVGKREGKVRKYVVEQLLERKKIGRIVYFSVKWKNFDKPTDERRSDLMKDVPDLVREFESRGSAPGDGMGA